MINLRPQRKIKWIRKIRKKPVKGNLKYKTIPPLQKNVMLLGPFFLKAKRRNNAISQALIKISWKSPMIIVIRKVTTPGIILRQKTNCNLSNLHISDYELGG